MFYIFCQCFVSFDILILTQFLFKIRPILSKRYPTFCTFYKIFFVYFQRYNFDIFNFNTKLEISSDFL